MGTGGASSAAIPDLMWGLQIVARNCMGIIFVRSALQKASHADGQLQMPPCFFLQNVLTRFAIPACFDLKLLEKSSDH